MNGITEKQFLSKVEELAERTKTMILEKAKKIFSCGAIEPSDYENDYLLPKIFMSAMGEEIEWQWKPLTQESIETRNNLKHFL